MQKFMIHTEKTIGRISPLLFGHNLEHTRSCMWNGLSAELVRNRKFAGKPAANSGQAAEWCAIGGRDVFLDMDWQDSYTQHYSSDGRQRENEKHAQKVVGFVKGTAYGIGQDKVPLQKGKKYNGRVVLKSPVNTLALVRILSADGKKRYFQTSFKPRDSWKTFQYSFKAPRTDEGARLEIIFKGPGQIAVGAVSLLPADHFYGMRRDVVELLKEIGTTILRWPGGNFAGDYRWQDGLFEVDRRAPLDSFMEVETLPHTGGFDNHEVGIDEFMKLCREIGAEPYISVNIAWETPEEIAAFVEYCNGPADSKWGAERAKRGNARPYGVKFWSLGNELGYTHMEGPNNPADYAKRSAVLAEAMKRADPSIQLTASGFWFNDKWFTDCLAALYPHLDHISHHWYSHHKTYARVYAEKDRKKEFAAFVNAPDQAFYEIERIREKMEKVIGGKKFVGISFDEWNSWYAWNRTPGVAEGIYAGGMLNKILNGFKKFGITIGCYFQPVNECAILVKPFAGRLTPIGQAMALNRAHYNNTALEVEGPSAGAVSAAASINGKNELVVTLVNKNPTGSEEAKIEVGGKKIVLKEAVALAGKDFFPGGVFEKQKAAAKVSGGAITVKMPQHSLARITAKLS